MAYSERISRILLVSLALLLLPATLQAKEKKAGPAKDSAEAKALSGISIVGNNEAPKSLYIVPWKGSELGGDSGLGPSLLDARTAPVDKEVFLREIHYYELRSPQ